MRRFRFRLDKVLKLRAHRERAARRALAEQLSVLGSIEDALRRVDHNLGVVRNQDGSATSAALARAIEAGLAQRRTRLEGDVQAAEQRVDLAREEYRGARVDHRVMSNLRSMRFDAWHRQVEAEAQEELDEMARTRFVRRQRQDSLA